MTRSLTRRNAAFSLVETLVCPGKKWRLSPYLRQALDQCAQAVCAAHIPIYQSVLLDLLRSGHLSHTLSILDLTENPIGLVAVTDILLAWETACAVYGIPSEIESVQVQTASTANQPATELLDAYMCALAARRSDRSGCVFLDEVHWLESIQKPFDANANLVLVSSAIGLSSFEKRADTFGDQTITVALSWEGDGNGASPRLFDWRRKWLAQHRQWVPLGPCGQEHGNRLPAACETCIHGRREPLHLPHFAQGEYTPAWSYVVLGKGYSAAQRPDAALTAQKLSNVVTDEIFLRYVGTFQEKTITTVHPDQVNDDPNDEKWQEYLKVCPSDSGATRLAIQRRSGMQIPPLQYGQWISADALQVKRPYTAFPNTVVLEARDEAVFHRLPQSSINNTFLDGYAERVRSAVNECALRLFGFASMRPFQHIVLEQVLQGRNLFAIAATGGGKSECYILPAMLLPGVTIVVSPLKSLILDQYEQRIRDRYGLDHLTTFINGDVPFYERQGRLRRLILGHFKLVYVTPEQLERGYVLDALRKANIRYLAMDEAHCISQWGHDFRPSYLNIVQRLREYNIDPVRIALTATASPLVREDICKELALDPRNLAQGGSVYIDSSNRPELNLVVLRTRTSEEKAKIVVDALKQLNGNGSAIVFMPHTGGKPESPKDMGAPRSAPHKHNVGMVSTGVTPFAHYLSKALEEDVAMYHGDMDDTSDAHGDGEDDSEGNLTTITRQGEQRSFMADQKRIMVATKGFGMGVDKPEIRLVIHRTPPANLEAYAQEAGRAGRDGKLATVILLYSDDTPQLVNVQQDYYLSRTKLSSDREIQEYFIGQRYVRAVDIAAMDAFLCLGQPLNLGETLFFTNDQVEAFFDLCTQTPSSYGLDEPYTWPEFKERKSTSYESSDHKQILDRGHEYRERRTHIGRILAVLFNNRPTIDGEIRPLVQSVHETGTLLREFHLYKPEKIIESTAYFGERLRSAGVTSQELQRLLPNSPQTSLVPLAQRLNLSLRETSSMLSDIRYCEGRTTRRRDRDYWVGSLLNFWWVESPHWASDMDDAYDLATWRRHAGAVRRVKPPSGHQMLDDFFPWSVVNRPQGWEVRPGNGLIYPDTRAYQKAFMALHDERRHNDENNYAYLLERYINNNGMEGECLRSLMLGYLKTNEVVTGKNCFGCSVCVPDLRFDRYSLEQRRQAVVRLTPETVAHFEQLEAMNRSTPSSALLDRLLDSVTEEEKQGRSGITYLDSWLARLIQDDPEHRSAHWLRLRAQERRILSLSDRILLTAVQQLVSHTTSKQHLDMLKPKVITFWDEATTKLQRLELEYQIAQLAERLNDWTAESERLVSLLAEVHIRGLSFSRRNLLERLLTLHRASGQMPDLELATWTAVQLAKEPNLPFEIAVDAYRVALTTWEWQDVGQEIEKATWPTAIMNAWLIENRNGTLILDWLTQNKLVWREWPPRLLVPIVEQMEESLQKSPQLLIMFAEWIATDTSSEILATRLFLRAWAAGNDLSDEHIYLLASRLPELDIQWCNQLVASRHNGATHLFQQILGVNERADIILLLLQIFPPNIQQQLTEHQLLAVLKAELDAQKTPSHELLSLLWDKVQQTEAEETVPKLAEMCEAYPSLNLCMAQSCPSWNSRAAQLLLKEIVPTLLNQPMDTVHVGRVLNQLVIVRRQLPPDHIAYVCLDNWRVLRVEAAALAQFARTHIEGRELSLLTSHWLRKYPEPHQLDMLVVILSVVQQRSNPNWKTPLALKMQALFAAGRFEEVRILAESSPDLRVNGKSPIEMIAQIQKGWNGRRADYDDAFHSLWKLFVATELKQ
jgi:superfamily II DNA/RNA helicase